MARMVATKAALSIRVDALSDAESRSDPQAAEVGINNRVKLESRLRALEHQSGIQSVRRVTSTANGRQQPKFDLGAGSSAGAYNSANDSVALGSVSGMLPTQPESALKTAVKAVQEVKEEKRAEKDESKKDKKKKRKSETGEGMDVDGDDAKEGETKEERRARKEAKKLVRRPNAQAYQSLTRQAKAAKKEEGGEDKKSKKRRASEANGGDEAAVEDGEKKKKKKKRDSEAA